jgi:hypothetical protein
MVVAPLESEIGGFGGFMEYVRKVDYRVTTLRRAAPITGERRSSGQVLPCRSPERDGGCELLNPTLIARAT